MKEEKSHDDGDILNYVPFRTQMGYRSLVCDSSACIINNKNRLEIVKMRNFLS